MFKKQTLNTEEIETSGSLYEWTLSPLSESYAPIVDTQVYFQHGFLLKNLSLNCLLTLKGHFKKQFVRFTGLFHLTIIYTERGEGSELTAPGQLSLRSSAFLLLTSFASMESKKQI